MKFNSKSGNNKSYTQNPPKTTHREGWRSGEEMKGRPRNRAQQQLVTFRATSWSAHISIVSGRCSNPHPCPLSLMQFCTGPLLGRNIEGGALGLRKIESMRDKTFNNRKQLLLLKYVWCFVIKLLSITVMIAWNWVINSSNITIDEFYTRNQHAIDAKT